MTAQEWRTRPHANCFTDENCGAQDCPPAVAMRKRAQECGRPWGQIVLGDDGGGYRHYLDGKPIHCGTTLELQEIEDRDDDYGSYSIFLQKGRLVRYELNTDEQGQRVIVLYANVAGHTFTARAEPYMRFRWPEAS